MQSLFSAGGNRPWLVHKGYVVRMKRLSFPNISRPNGIQLPTMSVLVNLPVHVVGGDLHQLSTVLHSAS